GGNRLVGFRTCIAPISAWLWLQCWKPLSLVLVAGGPGRSPHLQCDRARRITLRSNEHKLGFLADSFQCSHLPTHYAVPRSLSTAETRHPGHRRVVLRLVVTLGDQHGTDFEDRTQTHGYAATREAAMAAFAKSWPRE